MWQYNKQLQYPVNIRNSNPDLASLIISQLGGPDGELGASMRYLNQRYTMPNNKITGILTDVGISLLILPILLKGIRRKRTVLPFFHIIPKQPSDGSLFCQPYI